MGRPLVGAAFADLGADVVEVESSARLDPYRLLGVERDSRCADVRRGAPRRSTSSTGASGR